jgi:hypothetical protein
MIRRAHDTPPGSARRLPHWWDRTVRGSVVAQVRFTDAPVGLRFEVFLYTVAFLEVIIAWVLVLIHVRDRACWALAVLSTLSLFYVLYAQGPAWLGALLCLAVAAGLATILRTRD